MKKSKKLYILLGILLAVCIGIFAVSGVKEHQEKIKNSEETIIAVPTENFTAISWEYDDVSLAFHKDGEWLYDADEAFPVSTEIMEELLSHFNNFGVSFKIEDVDDYSQYGLDKPVCTVKLTAGEEEYELKMGAYSSLDEKRYVSVGDGNVYLVNIDPYDYFAIELSDMILNDEKLTYTSVESLSFTGDEEYEVEYIEESADTWCADDVYFKRTGNGYLPLDTSAVNSYVKTVSRLDFSNYASYNVTEAELEGFGLDKPELTAAVNYTVTKDEKDTSGSYTFSIAQDPVQKQEWAEKKANGEEIDEETVAYLRIGQSQIIYCLSGADYDALMAYKYDDLRHSDIFSADLNGAYKLTFTLDGEDYTFDYEYVGDVAEAISEESASEDEETEAEAENVTEATHLTANNKEEDREAAWCFGEDAWDTTELFADIKALTASEFTGEKPDGVEEISFTVYLDNENYPGITVTLYRYDGNNCLAAVNGDSVALVSRSSVVALIEALNSIIL